MEIAIFGAGIAGLTTAITLRAHGHSCRVLERSRQSHEAGMGFILVPEAIACLQSFGVHLAGAVGGSPLERYYCRNEAGRVVFEQSMPAGARGIRRRDLTTALVRALGKHATLVFDAELDGLEVNRDLEIASARLSAGKDKDKQVKADLYVGADGIGSRARQVLFPGWPTTYARVPEIVGLVHSDKAAAWAGYNFNKFHSDAGGIAVGVLPVGNEHVVWFLQFDAQRFPLSQEVIDGDGEKGAVVRRKFVEELVGAWADPIPSLLAMTDFSRVHLWRPIDTDLIPHFHRRNLVLVGDAAHPLSPFTSQGVASAVADAVALARALDRVKAADDLDQALARYSRERHDQCAPYLARGRELLQHFLEPLSIDHVVLPIATEIGA
jgi:salicylate hydroxylase